jgi:hypothetical protein
LAAIEGVKIVPSVLALNAASIPESVIATLLLPGCCILAKGISCEPTSCWAGFVNRSVRDWIDILYNIIKYY